MKRLLSFAALLVAACGSPTQPPVEPAAPSAVAEAAWPEADPADVRTLDGILQAYYEVVSGPAGDARDWDRDKSLHVPGALVVITRSGDDGGVVVDRMTISEYHDRQPGPAASAFYEYEIHRVVQERGTTVHVWSTYEHTSTPGGAPEGRGINSIELVWDGARYWITSWSYDGRDDAPPVPAEYLPSAS